MIISTIKDGFGNQLFMYACGYAIAKNSGEKLILDSSALATSKLRKYELERLNIKYDYLLQIPNHLPNILKILTYRIIKIIKNILTKPYNEKISYEFDPQVLELRGSYRLSGYWQSEQYFRQYRSDILAMLTPNYTTTSSF